MVQTCIPHRGGGLIFVTEPEEQKSRGIQRYRLTSHRTYKLEVLAFDQSKRTEHVVQLRDISVVGVGILSNEQIDPGLIYFKEPLGGQKFGVLVWSKPKENQFRAGIQFLILPSEEEAFLLEWVKQPRSFTTHQGPDKTIDSLLASITKDTNR